MMSASGRRARRHAGQDLGAVLALFGTWPLAPGLSWMLDKCVKVWAKGGEERHKAALRGEPRVQARRPADSGTYLGVEIGLRASAFHWGSVARKVQARAHGATVATNLAACLLLCGIHVPALVGYRARLAFPEGSTSHASRAPWMAFSQAFLYNMGGPSMPVAPRSPEHMSIISTLGVEEHRRVEGGQNHKCGSSAVR